MAREKGGPWIGLCVLIFYPVSWLVSRPRFSGREHIPAKGPALLVANHVSYLDPVFTAVFTHSAGRIPRFLAKDSLWNVPVLGRTLRSTEQIPVTRASGEAGQSLRAAGEALQRGKVVAIYPEGTITRDPEFWPMNSRTGVARLALEHDVPVIPMVHWNTHLVYDHYGRRFRPLPRREVVVRAGPPVRLDEFRGRPIDAELLREVTDRLMCDVRAVLAEVRTGEQPPTEFYSRSRGEEPGR